MVEPKKIINIFKIEDYILCYEAKHKIEICLKNIPRNIINDIKRKVCDKEYSCNNFRCIVYDTEYLGFGVSIKECVGHQIYYLESNNNKIPIEYMFSIDELNKISSFCKKYFDENNIE